VAHTLRFSLGRPICWKLRFPDSYKKVHNLRKTTHRHQMAGYGSEHEALSAKDCLVVVLISYVYEVYADWFVMLSSQARPG